MPSRFPKFPSKPSAFSFNSLKSSLYIAWSCGLGVKFPHPSSVSLSFVDNPDRESPVFFPEAGFGNCAALGKVNIGGGIFVDSMVATVLNASEQVRWLLSSVTKDGIAENVLVCVACLSFVTDVLGEFS